MKKLKPILFTFINIAILCSCGGNENASRGNSASTASATSSTASTVANARGDAQFSYNLDGTKISGGPGDGLLSSFNNQAHVTQNDYGNSVAFFLNDASSGNDDVTYPHSIRFVVKATTGTQQVIADEDHWSVQLFVSSGGSYIVYGGETCTVTITNISASRVSGTFSGKFKKATPGAGQEELTVTDGKFDIPLISPDK